MRAIALFLVGAFAGWILRSLMADPRFKSRLRAVAEERIMIADRPGSRSSPRKAGASRTSRDDLKQIKGVGPALEKKLKGGGLHTFASIAALSAAELQERVGSTRGIPAADLIAQAKKLARRS